MLTNIKKFTFGVFALFLAMTPVLGIVSVNKASAAGGPTCGADGVPYSSFWTDATIMTNQTANFTNYSDGCGDQITNYTWDFGDGTGYSSSAGDITHVYLTPGVFVATLTVTDEVGLTDSYSRDLNVRDVNQSPTANNDQYDFSGLSDYSLDSGNTITPDLRANDSDPEGDFLFAEVVTQPDHGSVNVGQSVYTSYTPEPGYRGPVSFTYRAVDVYGGVSNEATVTMTLGTVVPDPVAPTLQNDQAVVNEDSSVQINVYANDSDDQPLPGQVDVVDGADHGTLQNLGNGSFTYTPAANYNGVDSFVYSVTDADGFSSQAIVNITVNPVIEPPVAIADNFSVSEDSALSGSVTTNDSVEGVATYSLQTQAQHGTVSVSTDGTFTYTPATNYNGSDSFTYAVSNSEGSATATVSLTVSSINDDPTVGFNFTVGSHRNVSFANTSSDIDGTNLTYSWNFGDGGTSTAVSPTHKYKKLGNYIATLIVTDANGATAVITKTVSL